MGECVWGVVGGPGDVPGVGCGDRVGAWGVVGVSAGRAWGFWCGGVGVWGGFGAGVLCAVAHGECGGVEGCGQGEGDVVDGDGGGLWAGVCGP